MAKNFKNKKVAFFGTPFFAKEILKNLKENGIAISLVITQPAKPVGRKQKIEDSEVKKYSQMQGLKVIESAKIEPALISILKRENLSLIVTAAYGAILPKEVLEIPQLGAINVHPSCLPKYRGPAPIQYALVEGRTKTATTIMLMDEKMDTGEILAQKEITIEDEDTYPILENKLIKISNSLLLKTMEDFLGGKITPKKQNDNEATFSKTIKKNDGLIDWEDSANKIYNKYRGYYQWPKIFTYFNDNNIKKKIILHEIEKIEKLNHKLSPGEIGKQGKNIVVGTKKGLLKLKTIQIEGKNPMPIEQFIIGKSNFIGSTLSHT